MRVPTLPLGHRLQARLQESDSDGIGMAGQVTLLTPPQRLDFKQLRVEASQSKQNVETGMPCSPSAGVAS